MNQKHIVLITSGQPVTNPRLIKEADLFTTIGYKVTVLYCYWNKWATTADQELMSTRKWKLIQVAGSPEKNKISYYKSKLLNRLASCIATLHINNNISIYALSRTTSPLMKAASRIPADLYLAHNLAALPAAVDAANRNHGFAGFDAEDYHREETAASPSTRECLIKAKIEDIYIPQLQHFTASSSNIAALYQSHYQCSAMVVRNLLPKVKLPIKVSLASRPQVNTSAEAVPVIVKLFWFSQTIGPNRGIETIISALRYIAAENYELHLLGAPRPGYRQQLLELAIENSVPRHNLHFHKPVGPEELIKISATFDIGLASESGFCRNNDAALSNKLFTYIQAGLAVILSDTIAQRDFYDQNPSIGKCYKKDSAAQLAQAIQHYIDHVQTLKDAKMSNYLLGQHSLNWESECQPLVQGIKRILN